MASALSEYADILWVDPGISPLTPKRFRHGMSRWPLMRLVSIDSSKLRLSPAAPPFHSRGVMRPLTAWLAREQIRHTLTRIGRTPHAVIASHLGDVLGGWGTDVVKVFYGTDDFVGGADLMGTVRKQMEKAEYRQLHCADVVVGISSNLIERWRDLGFTGPMTLIPNGVDVESYRQIEKTAPAQIDLPRPVAGLVGHLSARIDISLLESIVEAGCSLLLVGPYNPQWEPTRFKALISDVRVAWVGQVQFHELPRYLQVIDVGIIPYSDSDFNRASFPLKILEYLAAGKPVVSTDLPAVHWLSTDLISVAGQWNFGEVVLAATMINDRSAVERRIAFAASHSWHRRAVSFAKAIGIRRE